MDHGTWGREELIALARGREIGARNLQASAVDPPAWLVGHSDGTFALTSAESVEAAHPDDRPKLINAFVQSLVSPGEAVTVQVRSRRGNRWRHTETVWLNLVDQDDVGTILFFTGEVDGPPIEVPILSSIGEHAATRWMTLNVSDFGHITSVEGACADLLGYEPHELIGRHMSDLIPTNSVADGVAMWVQLGERPGTTVTNRRQWLRGDNSLIWIEDSILNRADRDGDESMFVVLIDATGRVAQEEALHQREKELLAREAEKSDLAIEMEALAVQAKALAEEFQTLADEVPAAVFRCTTSGVVTFHNARWVELLGRRDEVTRLHDIVAPEEHHRLDGELRELGRAPSRERRQLELVSGDGTRVWCVRLRSAGDSSESILGSVEDVSATVELRREARRDQLTGLANRAALEMHLAQQLERDPTDLLVGFVDLDGFKGVNDTWGHDAGDTVLRELGRRLGMCVRANDLLARLGGDEFVVVYTEARATEPAEITDRLAAALQEPIFFTGGSWSPAASIGWTRGQVGDDTASVLRRADVEMFQCKRERRGTGTER